MKQKRPYALYIIILLIIAVTTINVVFTFNAVNEARSNNQNFFTELTGISKDNTDKIKESEESLNELANKVSEIHRQKHIVVRPSDGKDGKDGISIVGEKGEKGDKGDSIVGEKGKDGLTPEIRCNVSKNRWEYRYESTSLWQIMYSESNNKVKCTIKEI